MTIDTLQSQSLLDQADTSLDFVAQQENPRAMHVERIRGDFYLCYADFSFFINRHGWRVFPNWKTEWAGHPVSFATLHTYVLSFDRSFIEVWRLDTGKQVQILPARNIRLLHILTDEVIMIRWYGW